MCTSAVLAMLPRSDAEEIHQFISPMMHGDIRAITISAALDTASTSTWFGQDNACCASRRRRDLLALWTFEACFEPSWH